jgi:hypothetical protein
MVRCTRKKKINNQIEKEFVQEMSASIHQKNFCVLFKAQENNMFETISSLPCAVWVWGMIS